MKVLRWGVCALAALLMTAGSSFANDSEIEAMKAAMDNMKQEMDAMRSTMSAEREAMRESAGGAPEALRSNGGNATVRIGGAVAVRYIATWQSNDKDQGNEMSGGGEYNTELGWKMDTAKIDFNVQINEDLSAYIDVRPTKFDKAYFQWNNIGGTGLGAQVGLIGIPGGMYSASWSPTGSVLMFNPSTKSNLVTNPATAAGVSDSDDMTSMGVKLYYELDQFKITGTVFNNAESNGSDDGSLNNYNNYVGDINNAGISHSIMLEYSPAFMEGLHFSFTYLGDVNFTQDSYTNSTSNATKNKDATDNNGRGTEYNPTFDLGVAYVGDKFSAWITTDYVINPGYYSKSYAWNLSVGGNYNITEKLAIGAAYDMTLSGTGNGQLKPGGYNAYHANGYAYRGQIGAKYTLCNGVYFKANYAHTWYGYDQLDSNRDQVRGKDAFIFETGVSF